MHDAYPSDHVFGRYAPNLSYEVCDLSKLPEEQIKGAVLLQVTMRLMKHIRDGNLAAELPGIFTVLRSLRQQRTAVEYLDVLLRYLAGATDLDRQEVSQAITYALFERGEKLMSSAVAKWFPEALEQGRQEGRQKGRQEGLIQGQALFLIRLLEHRFGPMPTSYRQRIEAADPDTLLAWAERVPVAEQIEMVFEP